MAMNPNAAMANMNPMGGPVGTAPMPMMNNGAVNAQAAAAARQQQQGTDRGVLNTYIYDYFLRYGMYDCARTLLASEQPINIKDKNAVNGDDAMDTDSKDDIDSKNPEDLPAPKLPMPNSESSFLYEWFCLFWDIYNAQRTKGSNNGSVNQYVMHTQEILRGMPPNAQQAYQAQMVRNMQGNMAGMKGTNLARAAMANNQNPQMQMLQGKQNPMQRDPSNMNANQDRPSSPATGGDNAPSPSAKRQRTDGGPAVNAQQLANNPGLQQAQQLLLAHGINPGQLTHAQLTALASTPPHTQAKSIATYMTNMQNHHKQIANQTPMANVSAPQNQGSPMVPQPDSTAVNNFYNPPDIGGGMRPGAPGQNPGAGSNHALQDYQMQLMLLEQQNKKRLMMARQEQDNMGGGAMPRDGPPGPGPNGQFPDTSPQAMRSGASPNPGDQIKRGTPQMNNSGIPSPVPEGGQSRDSPNPAMNFMGNQVDPNMAPHFFKGMEGNMAGQAQMNGMRPPSSHPGGQQFSQQQMMAARAAQGQGNPQQWQPGPNGQMQGMPQNQQAGTPQQRAMPPPSAPAGAGANANNRTTASPQQPAAAPPTPNQTTKNAPKKKETKAGTKKAAANKKAAAANAAGATPAADGSGDGDSAAPATPMTPSFNKSASNAGTAAPVTTAPAASAAAAAAPTPSQGEPNQNGLGTDNNYGIVDFPGMEFAPLNTGDVLNDFDFDSFLHDGDGNNEGFDFNGTFAGMEGNEIGAE